MSNLFISHSSKDDSFVRDLRAALADQGQDVWIDSRELRGGDPLWPEIQKAIDEASAYAILVSPDSLQSKWVGKELHYALGLRDQRGKKEFPVIPLSLNDIKLGVLEELFGEEPTYIPVTPDADGVRSAMNAIMMASGKRLADVPAPTHPTSQSRTNPFPLIAICRYTERPTLTLKLDHILSAHAALDEYLGDPDAQASLTGMHVGIRGGRGSGKTHLLSDLAHEMRSRRKNSTCLYANGDPDSLELYKQLVHGVSLERLLHFFNYPTNKTSSHANTDKLKTLRELVGHPLDPAVEIAFQPSDSTQSEMAYRWLMGDPVQGFGELDLSRQLRILNMIAILHRAAGVPLLVLIDNLDQMLGTNEEVRDSVAILKTMLELLVRENAFLVIAGLDEAWKSLPKDARTRFSEHELRIVALSLKETQDLLDVYAGGNTHLSAEAIAAIHHQSGGIPRNILTIAHHLFEMYAGELEASTPKDVEQVAKKSNTQSPDTESAGQAGVSERVSAHSDNPALVDELDRKPFAEVIGIRIEQVSRGQVNGNQQASAFMVNLHGPWGAGKTSVLNFLKGYLQSKDRRLKDRWVVVEFNAWQHQRLQPPWWTLIKEIQAQAVSQLNFRDSLHVRIGWLWWRMRADWLPSIAAAVLMIVAVLLTTGVITLTKQAAGVSGAPLGAPQNPVPPNADQIAKAIELALKIIAALAATGAAVLAISRSLVFGSGSAAKAYVDARSDPLRPIIKLFRRLVRAIKRPLIVLVDDLDRCDGPYVISLLEGIQTLFRSAPVTYVVAADRKWICSSFEQKYGGFEKAIGEPGRPLGYLFLDKVFQVSASVPRLSQELQHTYWNALLGASGGKPGDVSNTREEADKKAIAEVRNDHTSEELGARIEASKATADPVAQQAMRAAAAKQITSPEAMLVTEHRLKRFANLVEANPRSMKRLVNSYGLYQAAHFLEGRTVSPEVLVRWTILELRWPLLAEHLTARPDSLRSVGAGQLPDPRFSDEIQRLLNDDSVQAVLGVDVKSGTIKLDEKSVREIIGTGAGGN